MKRNYFGYHRASRKKLRKRKLAMESLEPKVVLDGTFATFGFVSTILGFEFAITGTDYGYHKDNSPLASADNVVIWNSDITTGGVAATNFFVEWVNDNGTWQSIQGSLDAGTIAHEAARRGAQPSDFQGISVKLMGGDDWFFADGTGEINIYEDGDRNNGGTPIDEPFFNYQLSVDGNGDGDKINGSLGTDVIRGGDGNDIINANLGDDTVTGGGGDDQIDGGDGNDDLSGDSGRDKILGGKGDDIIRGGDDDDGVRQSGKNDKDKPGWGLFGGPGNDDIDGGAGDDDIVGDFLLEGDACTYGGAEFSPNDKTASDTLRGGPGDDSLLGDNHDKNPDGGSGNDTWQAGCTTTGGVKIDNNSGQAGLGGLLEEIRTDGTQAHEPDKRDKDQQPGQTTKKFRTMVGSGPFASQGTFTFNDNVYSGGWVKDGIDVDGVWIQTGGGNDYAVGSDPGKDILFGGDGNDVVAGLGEADYVDAGLGTDVLSGGPGGDDIFGGFENNPDQDGVNDDTLTYGPVSIPDQPDVPGSDDAVTVSLEGRLDWYLWNTDKNDNPPDSGGDFGQGGDANNDIILDSGGNNTNGNKSKSGGTQNSSIENLIGSANGDFLVGDLQANMIDGGAGDDTLFGVAGDDTLMGGDGKDTLHGDNNPRQAKGFTHVQAKGDPGSDDLFGGKDDDTLFGDELADTLNGEDGQDVLVGGEDADGLAGGKDVDTLVGDYSIDADLAGFSDPVIDLNGFGLYGDEEDDIFAFLKVKYDSSGDFAGLDDAPWTSEEMFDVRSRLLQANSGGGSDFRVNHDEIFFATKDDIGDFI